MSRQNYVQFVYRGEPELEEAPNIEQVIEKVLKKKQFRQHLKEKFLSSTGIIVRDLLFENAFYKDFLSYILLDKICGPLMEAIYEKGDSGLFTQITEILKVQLLTKLTEISCMVTGEETISITLKNDFQNLIKKISEDSVFREYDFLLYACEVTTGKQYQNGNFRQAIKDLFTLDNPDNQRAARSYLEDILSSLRRINTSTLPEKKFVKTIINRISFLLSLEKCMNDSQNYEFIIPLDYTFEITKFFKDSEVDKLKQTITELRRGVENIGSQINVTDGIDEFSIKILLTQAKGLENMNINGKIKELTIIYNTRYTKYFISSSENPYEFENAIKDKIGNLIVERLKEFKHGSNNPPEAPKTIEPVNKLRDSSKKMLLLNAITLVLLIVIVSIMILELYNVKIIKENMLIRDLVFYSFVLVLLVLIAIMIAFYASQNKLLINNIVNLRDEKMLKKICQSVRTDLFNYVWSRVVDLDNFVCRLNFDDEVKKEISQYTVYLLEQDIINDKKTFVEKNYKKEFLDVYVNLKKDLLKASPNLTDENIRKALKFVLSFGKNVFDLKETVQMDKKVLISNISRKKKDFSADQLEKITVYRSINNIKGEDLKRNITEQINAYKGSEEGREKEVFPIFVYKTSKYFVYNKPDVPEQYYIKDSQNRYILHIKKFIKDKILKLISFFNFLCPISYFAYDIMESFVKPSLIKLSKILDEKEIMVHDFSFMKLPDLTNSTTTEIIHEFICNALKSKFFLTRSFNLGFYVPKFFESEGTNAEKIYDLVYQYIDKEILSDEKARKNKAFLTSYVLNMINNIPLSNEGDTRTQINHKIFDLQNFIFYFICQYNQFNKYNLFRYQVDIKPFSRDVEGLYIILTLRGANMHKVLDRFRKVSLAISVVSAIIILSLIIDFNLRTIIKIPRYIYIIYFSVLVFVLTILLISSSVDFSKITRKSVIEVQSSWFVLSKQKIADIVHGIRQQFADLFSSYFFIHKDLIKKLLTATSYAGELDEKSRLLFQKRTYVIVRKYLRPLFIIQWYFLLRDTKFEYDLSDIDRVYSMFQRMFFESIKRPEFYTSIFFPP